MSSSLVLTVIGADRPGLVDSVAAVVTEHGGNWLESRMCRLGGQFAGILRVEAEPEQRKRLEEALNQLSSRGLEIAVHDSGEASEPVSSEMVLVEIVGQDRPGIVSHIAGAFASFEVNVEELVTERKSAPMSGEQLFEARVQARVPSNCSIDELRAALEKIAADLMVDMRFE